MANLKKLLAGAMALCMAGAMFASCGKDADKKDGDKKNNGGKGASAGSDVGDLKEEKIPNVPQNKDGSEDSKKQLKIYTWNDEFKSRLRNFYPEYDQAKSGFSVAADGTEKVGEHEYLKDGTEIVW